MTNNDFIHLIEQMNNSIVGQIFRHYKGKEYLAYGVCKHTETFQELVVYRSLYKSEHPGIDDYQVWTRPKDMFFSKMIIDGEEMDRFTQITN